MTIQTKTLPSFRGTTSITLDRSSLLNLIGMLLDPLTVII